MAYLSAYDNDGNYQDAGIHCLDISNPLKITQTFQFSYNRFNVYNLEKSSNILFVTSYNSQIESIDINDMFNPIRLDLGTKNSPNPLEFSKETIQIGTSLDRISINFDLCTKAKISMYAINGKKIMSVKENSYSPGIYSFNLNKNIPSGIYFVRIVNDSFSYQERIVISK